MPAQTDTRAPWELDPTERGLTEPTDLTDYLLQYDRCRHCHLLGRSTVDFCAAELPLTDLRAKAMLMRTCETAIKTFGDASQPRHGRKKPVAALA